MVLVKKWKYPISREVDYVQKFCFFFHSGKGTQKHTRIVTVKDSRPTKNNDCSECYRPVQHHLREILYIWRSHQPKKHRERRSRAVNCSHDPWHIGSQECPTCNWQMLFWTSRTLILALDRLYPIRQYNFALFLPRFIWQWSQCRFMVFLEIVPLKGISNTDLSVREYNSITIISTINCSVTLNI